MAPYKSCNNIIIKNLIATPYTVKAAVSGIPEIHTILLTGRFHVPSFQVFSLLTVIKAIQNPI